jgi:hypothetical protein
MEAVYQSYVKLIKAQGLIRISYFNDNHRSWLDNYFDYWATVKFCY